MVPWNDINRVNRTVCFSLNLVQPFFCPRELFSQTMVGNVPRYQNRIKFVSSFFSQIIHDRGADFGVTVKLRVRTFDCHVDVGEV